MYQEITSATNPLIKSVVKLHTHKGRTEEKRCIIEGIRALSSALPHLTLRHLFCTEEQLSQAHVLTSSENIILIRDQLMKKISPSTTPSGLLGVFEIPPAPSLELGPGIVLAQIQDPGNMGTLIRTAVACNVTSIIIIEGCDPWSPKVLQASAGTSATIPIYRLSWKDIMASRKNLKLYALVAKGGSSPSTIDPSQALLVVGNEAQGIPEEWLSECTQQITLPMPGQAESLNAAVAGSIALYFTFAHKDA